MASNRNATQSTYISDFIHLITLSRIQGDILEFIRAKYNSTSKPNHHSLYAKSPTIGADQDRDYRAETSTPTFALLDKSLIEWQQNLPEALQNPTAQSPHFGLFLHLTFNTLIILLHRPEVPNSQTSASLCTQAAVAISDIVEILMDAKALTSMFVTCLYAIFSAGIVHFINIPSVQRSSASTTSSPVLSEARGRPTPSATSAKSNLKRCIDALKFLSNHWVSAARRAKILEDLLDLKHVSLKDLEVDTFKYSPVGPSWAMETEYKDALIGSREGQDHLRQQCRSKVMAIHSLLANDDEFKRMQRRTSLFSEQEMSSDDMSSADEDSEFKDEGDVETETKIRDTPMDLANHDSDDIVESSASGQRSIGLGLGSPLSSAHSVSPPANGTTQPPVESEQGMTLSTSGLDDSKLGSDANENDFTPRPVTQESGLLTPMTMTTMAHCSTSPTGEKSESSQGFSNEKNAGTISSASSGVQGAMLDPFSMPSSISFSEWNHDRRPNNGHGGGSGGGVDGSGSQTVSQLNTVWTTDAITNRTTARSTTSSPMIPSSGAYQDLRPSDSEGQRTVEAALGTSTKESQPLSLYHEAITHAFPGSKLAGREDQDLVWNDMPPTLGLDEWTDYIGAMMMRWLYASGQSSPGSTIS